MQMSEVWCPLRYVPRPKMPGSDVYPKPRPVIPAPVFLTNPLKLYKLYLKRMLIKLTEYPESGFLRWLFFDVIFGIARREEFCLRISQKVISPTLELEICEIRV